MRIDELKSLIKETNDLRQAYYNEGNSPLGDYEYDKKVERIHELETELGIIFSNSPTQTVGFKVRNKLNKITHKHKMLSLDKLHSIEEVNKFIGNHTSVVMVKMDGLTISAEYQNGDLVRLETRGNGEEGNDVLFHARSFLNLPQHIPYKGTYVIDGEAIITYSDFEFINASLPATENKYRNPRNLAAGTLNLLNQSESKGRCLRFIAWDVIEGGSVGELVGNLDEADLYGFTTVPRFIVMDTDQWSTDIIAAKFDSLRNKAKELDYPSDGIVVKYNDIKYGLSLGYTGHHFNNAIAYKFEDATYKTKVREIIWSIGKTRNLCPVAVFEPVEIDGTMVERASLHNLSNYMKLEVFPGDEVLVYKANQIIPQISNNLSAETRTAKGIESYLPYPDKCPICGAPTQIVQNNDTQVLMCTNDTCGGALLKKMKNFVSKQGMDISGFSQATLEKLIDKGWINDLYDIYTLDEKHAEDMKRMDGFGVRSVTNLMKAIEDSKYITLDKFICALSIEGIGKSQSKVIAKEFDYNWDLFKEALCNNYNFSSLEGIGPVLNKRIYDWKKSNFSKVIRLALIMHFQIPAKTVVDVDLSGNTFVITGSLKHFANREELKSRLEGFGAKVSGSVSANTSFLINNDSQSMSSKNKKAKELGVPILSEEELIDKFKI